jgi:hypothetical protein
MIEVLEFVFRDFWTWLGTTIMLLVIMSPLAFVAENHFDNKDNKN